jgi:L-cysteine:1D-myo-inositol 2-amino-2-deoxy-alpha-D-glucopyranoside ligase
MIGLDGEKMSKSRGNLVFVSKLRGEGVDPMAIRLALLSGHYRTDRTWTADLLRTAEERLATWRRAVALDTGAPAAPLLLGLRERLSDDLDSPGAIALVDAWAAETLAGGADVEEEAPRIVCDAVDALLGVALDSSARGPALDSSARGPARDSSARDSARDSFARRSALGDVG